MGLTTLRGRSLGRIIGLVGAVGFVLQGYDQAVANGLLTLDSFISVFPEIDTVNTHGSQKSHNSTIQGMLTAKKRREKKAFRPVASAVLIFFRDYGRNL